MKNYKTIIVCTNSAKGDYLILLDSLNEGYKIERVDQLQTGVLVYVICKDI